MLKKVSIVKMYLSFPRLFYYMEWGKESLNFKRLLNSTTFIQQFYKTGLYVNHHQVILNI